MIGHGVNFVDFEKMQIRCAAGEDYVSVCEELGDRDIRLADEAYIAGHRATASTFYFAACHMFRVGCYGLIELTEENCPSSTVRWNKRV